MRWKMMLGMMVAVGSLTATRAQANAGDETSATPAQQEDTAGNPAGDNAHPGQSADAGYGKYVEGPATVDADGVPVAKPNPMSHFEKNARTDNNVPVEMPLVDDPRTDKPAADGQTK
jgi:hypothetical protein